MMGLTQAAWWQLILLGLYTALVVVAWLRHVFYSRELRNIRVLTRRSPAFRGIDAPLVSILIPAKDEAGGIEACLRSVCAQDYPNYEILVVDDRSEDDTAAIVGRWAARDARIRLLRISELPPQWTGKSHALHQCQKEARGEWFFFVDADTLLDPSCLSVAMRDALDSGADLQSLMPALISTSFWVNVVQPVASTLLVLLYPISRVNNQNCKDSGFANGQFILVRRDAYRGIGGHEAVRDRIGEDVQLGKNARAGGLRLRLVVAPELAVVRMYASVQGIVAGWSRIFYFASEGNIGRLLKLAAGLCLFSLLPYAVLFVSGGSLLAGSTSSLDLAAFGLAAVHAVSQWTLYARLYSLSKTSLRYLPLRIVGVFVMLHVLRKSARICRTHEITWRGTSYGTDLRAEKPQGRAAA